MQNTTNYNLNKPDNTDNYDVVHQNSNMEIIDGQMKANADSAIAAQNTADAAETPTGAQTKADTAETNAKTYADTQDNDLAGVGRTTETVKGNADAVATHLADTTAQDVGGTGTAITITLQDFTAYTDNYLLTFIAAASNAGAATTININGLGVKSVYKPNTVTAPNFVAGKAYTVWYDSVGGNFFWKASAEGDAVVANVLAGKTFSNDDDTGLIGAMPNNGATGGTIINQGGTVTIPAGFTTGGNVEANISNLIAANIKDNVNVGGIVGTFSELANGATAAQILATRSAAVNGSIVNGAMVDRAGDTAALAIATSVNTLRLRPSVGFRDGVNDWVTRLENNWIPSNIKNTVSMFGKVGTLEEMNIASGTGTVNASGQIIVSGLSFSPQMVYVHTGPVGVTQKFVASARQVSATEFEMISGEVRTVSWSGAGAIVDNVPRTVDGFTIYFNDAGAQGLSATWYAVG